MLYAWKNGLTTVNETNMNALISGNVPSLITEGTQRDAKTGAGVRENHISDAGFCAQFTLVGSTELSRIELELDRDGAGADLVVQIRAGMDPGTGIEGTLLKQVLLPKEFVPDPKGWWSIPIGLSGLTAGAQYWIYVLQGGDSTNRIDWVGESVADPGYPAWCKVYDNWVAAYPLHFRVYSGVGGDYVHAIDDVGGHATLVYDGQELLAIYDYLPAEDGSAGIRDITTLVYSGDYILGGA